MGKRVDLFGSDLNKDEKILLLRKVASEMAFDRVLAEGGTSFSGRKAKALVVYVHEEKEYLLTKSEALGLTSFGLRVPSSAEPKEKKTTKRLKDIL